MITQSTHLPSLRTLQTDGTVLMAHAVYEERKQFDKRSKKRKHEAFFHILTRFFLKPGFHSVYYVGDLLQ